jgi:hypothetical protein
MAGRRPVSKLVTEEQRQPYCAQAPHRPPLDDLSTLVPIKALKLRFVPDGYDRRLVAELWNYSDGSRILELSTKCAPDEAFEVAAPTRLLLAPGIDLLAEQVTKTKTALEFFANELANAATDR